MTQIAACVLLVGALFAVDAAIDHWLKRGDK